VKRLADQTLYEILEVPRDAPPPAIEAAYARARSLYAPGSLATYTLMTAEEAALLTSRIEEAKRTLLDAEARARYDAALATPAEAGRAVEAADGGAPAAPFGSAPPVIPALQPSERRVPAEPPTARAAELLQGAALPPPAPVPIRLEREILPPPAPAPASREPEIPMPEGALWTGDALRRVREARGITIQQIADKTKVTRHHVENIEAERFSALPAAVYLRGILLAVARELRLDGQKVARAYLERAGASRSGDAAPKAR
jgi:curved DNA-binding protein CbpA